MPSSSFPADFRLHEACLNGSMVLIKECLKNPTMKHNLNVCYKDHGAPLHILTKLGEFDLISYLLKHFSKSFNIDLVENTQGYTAIHISALHGNLPLTKLLHEHGASLDFTVNEGYSPSILHLACYSGNPELVEYIVAQNPSLVSELDAFGTPPLHIACADLNLAIIKILVTNNASCKLLESDNSSCLLRVLQENNANCHDIDITNSNEFNLKNGDEKDKDKDKDHMSSLQAKKHQILHILVKAGAPINSPDKKGFTPFLKACEFGYLEDAKELVKLGADPFHSVSFPVTDVITYTLNATHIVAHCGNSSFIEYLCGELKLPMNTGVTPLHFAAHAGHWEHCLHLVPFLTDTTIDALDHFGHSPLYIAAKAGQTDCCKILLENNANPILKDWQGFTPLHIAISCNHIDAAKVLLRANNKELIVLPDSSGRTPLHLAAARGQEIIIMHLSVIYRCPKDVCDVYGDTPLHVACSLGLPDIVSQLISDGLPCNLNIENHLGQTPLMVAAAAGSLEIIQLLLQNGAAINNSEDIEGKTVLFHALDSAHLDIIEYLLSTYLCFTAYCNRNGQDIYSYLSTKEKCPISREALEIIETKSKIKHHIKHNPQFFSCLKIFNRDAKAGIFSFIEANIIRPDFPRDVAVLLHSHNDFSKIRIGDLVGRKEEFWQNVLRHFVGCLDFKNRDILFSLRMFLSKFRLPGEAQQIDRVMQCFANHYFLETRASDEAHKQLYFSHEDPLYVLAFSIIMLNTDLHNDTIKKENKMTFPQFLTSLRGVNAGSNLPESLLSDIYTEIRETPLKMEIEGQFGIIRHAGWMTKRGGRIKTWKRRYFSISENALHYFKHPNTNPLGYIPLNNVNVNYVQIKGKAHCIKLSSNENEAGSTLKGVKISDKTGIEIGHHHSYIFSCDNEKDKDEWIRALRHNIHDPLAHMFESHRRKASSAGLLPSTNSNLKG